MCGESGLDGREFWLETDDYSVQFIPNKPVTEVRIFRTVPAPSMFDLSNHKFTLTSYGLARMKPGDRYDERIGCRKAFESALRHDREFNDDPMPKEDRAAIWEQLREKYPEPKKYPESKILDVPRWFIWMDNQWHTK